LGNPAVLNLLFTNSEERTELLISEGAIRARGKKKEAQIRTCRLLGSTVSRGRKRDHHLMKALLPRKEKKGEEHRPKDGGKSLHF